MPSCRSESSESGCSNLVENRSVQPHWTKMMKKTRKRRQIGEVEMAKEDEKGDKREVEQPGDYDD